MTEVLGALLAASLIILIVCGGFILGQDHARDETMKEAFYRGYAVQCVGKSGYYWECEE